VEHGTGAGRPLIGVADEVDAERTQPEVAELLHASSTDPEDVEVNDPEALATSRNTVGGGFELPAKPVPLSIKTCGLAPALSVTAIAALRGPAAPGVNVIEIAQLTFTPSIAGAMGQLLVSRKSVAFEPVRLMLEIVRSALPVLLRVPASAPLVTPTVCVPKLNAAGDTFAIGELPLPPEPVPALVPSPVPESGMSWGLPPALSTIEIAALLEPEAEGVNETLILHSELGARVCGLIGQVTLCNAKSPAFAPVMLMSVKIRFAVPMLSTVRNWPTLVVPVAWLPNAKL
jgi:hypothetical protein